MKNKSWGGRFQKPLDKRAVSFNASLSFDYILFPYDISGSQAHATMLAKQGLITELEAQDICNALEVILAEMHAGKIVLDETFEDIHMLVEHHLIEKIGETGKKLHTGRSRNDQVALDLRLYIKDAAFRCNGLLKDAMHCLEDLARTHQSTIMPGYTHLQQAQPITLGCYFDAYKNMFMRDASRFKDFIKRTNYSPLGAGALAGSSLPLDRNLVANLLGFEGVIDNTLDAVSDRDFVIEFCSIASIIMVHLSRLSEDLIIWATQEFNFITLDDSFATGSSLMPNKKNPDILELIRGKSGRVFGHLFGILTVMKGLPLSYNKDMQEDKELLFDTVNTLNACLHILPLFLKSIHFNIEHMSSKVNQGFLDATLYVEKLVTEKGLAFRDAHEKIGEWVLEATQHKLSLKQVYDSKVASL